MPCEKCAPFGGLWMQTDSGLKRCNCAEGRRLVDVDEARKHARSEPPVLSRQAATVFVSMLSTLPFFPSEDAARSLIGEVIRCMCRNEEEATWLVKRVVNLCAKWPGLQDLRRIYCSKYRPLDGMEFLGPSDAFPDGVPSERQIEEPPLLALPAGRVATAAASIDGTIADLAEAKRVDRIGQRAARVRDIPILPPGQRITQSQIDEAIEQKRNQMANEELHGEKAG